MTGRTILELERVSKRFGRAVALRDVDLTVDPGEAVAVLGANGAGKTTLLRTIATLARPTRGRPRFGSMPGRADTGAGRLGVVAHQPYLYPELTCRENLVSSPRCSARLTQRVDAVLERVGLTRRP